MICTVFAVATIIIAYVEYETIGHILKPLQQHYSVVMYNVFDANRTA